MVGELQLNKAILKTWNRTLSTQETEKKHVYKKANRTSERKPLWPNFQINQWCKHIESQGGRSEEKYKNRAESSSNLRSNPTWP